MDLEFETISNSDRRKQVQKWIQNKFSFLLRSYSKNLT